MLPLLRGVLTSLGCLLGMFLSGCEGAYLLRQGAGQVALLLDREPVTEVLRDPGLSPRHREKLELVAETKRFARASLELKDPGSYEHLCRLDRDALSWVVSACPEDSLKPHTWWFPLVGAVPYKGFFDATEARDEATRLARQGLVVHVRPVEAFSLLGWIPDPLYSPMLEATPERLVEIVIHELTHATVFLPGQPDFNEAIATFVGRKGARAFRASAGAGFFLPIEELDRMEDARDRHNARMRALVHDLEEIFHQPWTRTTRIQLAQEHLERTDRELGWRERHGKPLDVADASLFRTYESGEWRFEALLTESSGNLASFIRSIKDALAAGRDVNRLLESWRGPTP